MWDQLYASKCVYRWVPQPGSFFLSLSLNVSESGEALTPSGPTLTGIDERLELLSARVDELAATIGHQQQSPKPWFSDSTWHALTNPANAVNVLSVLAGVIPFIAGNEAVKANAPEIAMGLLTFNGVVTSVLSWYRDKNNPPPTVYQNPELKPGAK